MFKILLTSIFILVSSSAFANDAVTAGPSNEPQNPNSSPTAQQLPSPPSPSMPYRTVSIPAPAPTSNGGMDQYSKPVTLTGETQDFTWEWNLNFTYVGTEGARMNAPSDVRPGQLRCKRKNGTASTGATSSGGAQQGSPTVFQACRLLSYEVAHTDQPNSDLITLRVNRRHDHNTGTCGNTSTVRVVLRATCN